MDKEAGKNEHLHDGRKYCSIISVGSYSLLQVDRVLPDYLYRETVSPCLHLSFGTPVRPIIAMTRARRERIMRELVQFEEES